MKTAAACGNRSGAAPCPRVGRRPWRSVACATRVGAPREFRQARRSAGNGTTRHCNGPRPRWNRAAAYGSGAGHDETLLMRAWRRFGAYGLALAAAWPRPGRCANMSDKASRAGGGQRARCRTTGRGRGPGGGRGWTNRTCATAGSRGLGAPCQPGSAGGASIAGRGAVSGYRCGRDHPAGTSAGPTRRAGVGNCGCSIASRNARLECDRRRSRAVGWPAARGRQRRRLRILCPRRQAQRRSGAVGGRSCPSARRPTMARRTRRTPCWRSARGCPALRRCPTGRHPDGHAASPGRRGGRGRRGSGRSGRLAGHARRIPSGGRRCHPLRRPAGRPGAARCGRRIRRRGRRGATWR